MIQRKYDILSQLFYQRYHAMPSLITKEGLKVWDHFLVTHALVDLLTYTISLEQQVADLTKV